jgi:mRNA interferase MazF
MRRGEVWEVNLDPTIGAEMKKVRPCVIVNRDALARLPFKIIVPLTEWKEGFARAPWLVFVEANAQNGLSSDSSADTYQVRSVSEARFVARLGEISDQVMEEINKGLIISLALD